jgi:hypothetical protein
MRLVWTQRAPGGWRIVHQPNGFVRLMRHRRLVMETTHVRLAQLEAQRISDQEDPVAAHRERRQQARSWERTTRARARQRMEARPQ